MTDEDNNKFMHNSVIVEVDYEVPLVSAMPLTNETLDLLNAIKFGKLLAQDKRWVKKIIVFFIINVPNVISFTINTYLGQNGILFSVTA